MATSSKASIAIHVITGLPDVPREIRSDETGTESSMLPYPDCVRQCATKLDGVGPESRMDESVVREMHSPSLDSSTNEIVPGWRTAAGDGSCQGPANQDNEIDAVCMPTSVSQLEGCQADSDVSSHSSGGRKPPPGSTAVLSDRPPTPHPPRTPPTPRSLTLAQYGCRSEGDGRVKIS